MESKAQLFGHPIHQMLIVFPLGGLVASSSIGWRSALTRGAHLNAPSSLTTRHLRG